MLINCILMCIKPVYEVRLGGGKLQYQESVRTSVSLEREFLTSYTQEKTNIQRDALW